MPLPPAPFDACDKLGTRTNSQSLVRYRTNDYSVPVRENSTPPPHLLEGCEGEQNRCGPSHIRIMINTVGIGESGYRWLLSVRLRH